MFTGMSRESLSKTEQKKRIVALEEENRRLEESLARFRRENFVLSDRLHLYEQSMKRSSIGLFRWQLNADDCWLSESAYALLMADPQNSGTPAELLADKLHPSDLFGLKKLFLQLSKGELANAQRIIRVKTEDDSYKSLLVNFGLESDENRQPLFVLGTVTETRFTFASSKEHFSLQRLPISYLRFRIENGAIIYANPKAEELLAAHGIFPAENIAELMGPGQEAEVTRLLHEEGSIDAYKININGFHALLSAHRLEEEAEALLLDIGNMQRTLDTLQKVNNDLDNFVYHASHDLRAPLRTVLGLLNILKGESSKEQREKCVDLIEGSIKRLDTLVVDLLSISRNNRRENPLVKINFMEEVNFAIASFYQVSETRNLEITTKISQPYPFTADLTRLRIVLNNLISNALKYRRFYVPRSFIDIRIWVDPQAAHIEIEDNGEGIPEDKLDQVFDMFVRASERSEGSGLGLYIVRDVLEKMGGSISIKSVFDKGTTVSVTIPNHQAEPSSDS